MLQVDPLFEEHHLLFSHVVCALAQSHQRIDVVIPDFFIPVSLLTLSVAMALTDEEHLLHVLLDLNLEFLVLVIVFSLTIFVQVSLLFNHNLSQEELLTSDNLHDLVDAEGPLSSGHSLQLNNFSDAFSVFHHFNLNYKNLN